MMKFAGNEKEKVTSETETLSVENKEDTSLKKCSFLPLLLYVTVVWANMQRQNLS